MICHVVHYLTGDESSWGVLHEGRVYALPDSYPTTREFLGSGSVPARALLAALKAGEHAGAGIELEHLELLSPVTRDARVLCQGANYRQHMIESGMDPDAKNFNMFFNKSGASICATGQDVLRPAHVQLLDYEVELGLVIGGELREPKDITPQNLHEHVAGIVIGNDLSARDVQIPQSQFFKGKSYRGFCPVGPVLCLLGADDLHYLQTLDLELKVNGEVRQKDSTSNLVFGPAESLSELSQVSDLVAGDLVLTGTPHGCALQIPTNALVRTLVQMLPEKKKWAAFIKGQLKSDRYLKPDDVVCASIRSADGAVDLGLLENRIVQG